jgi:hypothetical protein
MMMIASTEQQAQQLLRKKSSRINREQLGSGCCSAARCLEELHESAQQTASWDVPMVRGVE